MRRSLQEWLAEQRAKSTMSVESCSLEEMEPWGYFADSEGNFIYGRADSKFFKVGGIRVTTNVREVATWSQPMNEDLGGPGVIILITNGRDFYVSAREEPGNPPEKNYILLGASLQASEANLQQSHGGKRPPRAELYDFKDIHWSNSPADGGRYRNKVNRTGIIYAGHLDDFELAENEFIATRQEMYQARVNGDCNPHLSEAIAVALLM